MRDGLTVGLVSLALMSTAAVGAHLTLVDSRPKEGAVLSQSPKEVWLRFNQRLDVPNSTIAVRGPAGAVALADVSAPDSLSLSAEFVAPLEPGEYTVSWLGTPYEDHPVRGRYKFTVEAINDPLSMR